MWGDPIYPDIPCKCKMIVEKENSEPNRSSKSISVSCDFNLYDRIQQIERALDLCSEWQLDYYS